MWVVGADFYGKVDRIPGVCHVRTRFLHVLFFPFVPTSSFLVIEPENPAEFRNSGNPSLQKAGAFLIAEAKSPNECAQAHVIRLNWKSIIFAWVRALLVVLVMVCWGGSLELLFGQGGAGGPNKISIIVMSAANGIGFCGLYLATLPLSRPGKKRSHYLLALVSKARNWELPVQDKRSE